MMMIFFILNIFINTKAFMHFLDSFFEFYINNREYIVKEVIIQLYNLSIISLNITYSNSKTKFLNYLFDPIIS